MQKTLLLVFIHGFKGGESTFGPRYKFTEDLARLVADYLPKLNIKVMVYPRFETRGDLHECVCRFREWLVDNVIDIEVKEGTPSPTVDPSVRTILIGHSMGGIVAAETVLAIARDQTIRHSSPSSPSSPLPASSQPTSPKPTPSLSPSGGGPASPAELTSLMFPYIQAVLAYDTPFLGIAPGVVAHGAQGHWNTASAAYEQFNQLRSALGWGTAGPSAESAASNAATAAKALPSTAGAATTEPATGWGGWGKIAMVAGAVGTLAAGGAAAYMNRETITTGWSWVTSHLEFVGCLSRKEELKARVSGMVRLNETLGIGFANLYTRLGPKAVSKETVVGTVVGKDRTFCNLPRKLKAGTWNEQINADAGDEALAHMSMFEEQANPGYNKLLEESAKLIASWTHNDWYEDSRPNPHLLEFREVERVAT